MAVWRKENEISNLSILAFGTGWLAVEKPAGLTVHNDTGKDLCARVSVFLRDWPAELAKIGIEPDFGIHPVHRLDRETSGVVLLATSRDRFRFFSEQFAARRVKKHYVAIVHGCLETLPEKGSWNTWRRSLGKTSGGRNNPLGAGRRRPSETRFRVLDYSAHYTRVAILLETGRTHQIRRHAKLAGHPVVGDRRYGSTRALKHLRENFDFDRLALHARALILLLPGEKVPRTIESPAVPVAIRTLFENDRNVPGPSVGPVVM